MDLVYARKGCCKSCDRLDLFHRIIKCGDHRNADHQSGFSVERNPSCILQHQSVGPSCKFFMFFLIHMLDIHQIYIQIGKYLFNLFPWGTGHTFYRCVDSSLLCRAKKISGKVRLTHTFPSRKGDPASGTIIIGTVFFHLFDHLTNCHVAADHFIFSQNLHVLDPVFL